MFVEECCLEGAGGPNGERNIEVPGEQTAPLGWGEALEFVPRCLSGDLKSLLTGVFKNPFKRRFALLCMPLSVVEDEHSDRVLRTNTKVFDKGLEQLPGAFSPVGDRQ
ncbi:hypothetical protein [Corallococcus terminator]|uniref:hypothetical protein n=1 Tax=Corallococcus terminator TaxID=2316733 RepID=UPI001FC93593|nr:hypothetical protein [Corallococcus terminator]